MQKNKNLPLFLTLFLIISSFTYSCKRKTSEITIIPDALKNHLQNIRLLGNLSSVTTDTYFYSGKDSNFVFLTRIIQLYNSEGYITQVFEFDRNMDTVSQKTVYYLSDTKENYWEEFNYKDHSFTKDTFIYNNYGFKTEERFILNNSFLYKNEYKTDGIGGVIEMKRFLPEYQLTNKIYYNEFGLVHRIEEYDPQNKLYKYFTIEYDNHGNEVNRRAFKSSNEIIEYTYSQYNNSGLLQKIIFEDRISNFREDKIYTQHDAAGNWLEEIVMRGKDTLGKRVRRIEYE